MTTIEVLREARRLIEDPARWTQQTDARDAAGRPVEPSSDRAVCWCAMGALERAGEAPIAVDRVWFAYSALNHAMTGKGSGDVGAFNDSRTHAEVLAAFDAALTKATGGAAE